MHAVKTILEYWILCWIYLLSGNLFCNKYIVLLIYGEVYIHFDLSGDHFLFIDSITKLFWWYTIFNHLMKCISKHILLTY